MPALLRLAKFLLAVPLALAGPALPAADVLIKCVDQNGQPAGEVVVALEPLDGPKPPPAASAAPAEVTQQNETFAPQVTAIRAGGSVSFANHERKIMHQIYSRSKIRVFEIPLHTPGNTATITFDEPGLVEIGCSIHHKMSAFIYVLDTPWFAKSTAAGEARIAGVPEGRFRLTLQHPRLEPSVAREITLPATAPLTFTLAIKPPPRVNRVLEAGGGGYK